MQYIDKAALVAEIEARYNEYSSSILRHYDACTEARASELGKILVILNPLEVKEVQEEPVSKNLEEAARKAGQKYFPDEENIWARPNYEAKKAECAFKEGANWGRNQAKVEIQAQSMALPNGCPNKEPANDDLEEAAMQYAILKHKDAALQKIVSWDFKAGAEWQKEQMMKDAVYGLVCGHDESSPAWIDLNLLNKPNVKVGTEVKLIIIKDE